MIDRKARDVLGECTRLWLEGELTVDELAEVALEYEDSKDRAVSQFATLVDYSVFENDLLEPETWPKCVWDELQRHLLLLDSDRELQITQNVIWTRWQLVAVAGVLVFAIACWAAGPWWAFTWLSLPSGILSWFITKKKIQKIVLHPWHEVLHPFESFASMRHTLDEVNENFGFVKMKWSGTVKRKFPSSAGTALQWIIYCCLLPTVFVLPFQALPVFHTKLEVVPAT